MPRQIWFVLLAMLVTSFTAFGTTTSTQWQIEGNDAGGSSTPTAAPRAQPPWTSRAPKLRSHRARHWLQVTFPSLKSQHEILPSMTA